MDGEECEWALERQRRIDRLEQLIAERGKSQIGLQRKISRERAVLTLGVGEGNNAATMGILARLRRAAARAER